MRRASLIAIAVAAAACSWTACSRPATSDRPKLIVLGFDGMDPTLLDVFLKRGEMPAFSRLIKSGGLTKLETTVSPESPTSWASFATGVNPGKHNIYDFLVRDTKTQLGSASPSSPRRFSSTGCRSRPNTRSAAARHLGDGRAGGAAPS
jgi:hypothetical protein